MGTAARAASAGVAGPSEGLRPGRSSGRTKPEYTAASGRHEHAATGAGRRVSPTTGTRSQTTCYVRRDTSRVSTQAPNGARRAVGTHYGPTRIHRADHATRVRGTHYEPDYGLSHGLHYGPRYRSSYAAMHAGPTTATAPPRRWTGRRTTLDTYIWRSRPRAPGAPDVMTPTCAAGDRTRSAEV